MDRAITLKLRRKLPHEQVERLRHAEEDFFKQLQTKLEQFAADYQPVVRRAKPDLPSALNDREQDNWEPLLAIADVAGADWSSRARDAALKLSALDNATSCEGTDILSSIQEIFEQKNIDRISSADLIDALCADDEQSWATYNHGKPMSPRQLASLLKEYGIKSKTVRIGYATPKGFEQTQFDDAFSRYLTPSELIRHTQQTNASKAFSVADGLGVAATSSSSATEILKPSLDCCGVVDKFEKQNKMSELDKSWAEFGKS